MKHPIPMLYALTATLLLTVAAAAHAARDPADPFRNQESEIERGEFSYDDSQDTPWQESIAEVPPLPADADLLPVRVDVMPRGLQAYLAPSALAYDEQDRVLRFWLIIKSQAGAYNASYEGLRCDVREYRIYAYGNPRRKPPVQAAPNSAWKPVSDAGAPNYRSELMHTLLCGEARSPRPLAEIVGTLKGYRAYRNPSADNIDY